MSGTAARVAFMLKFQQAAVSCLTSCDRISLKLTPSCPTRRSADGPTHILRGHLHACAHQLYMLVHRFDSGADLEEGYGGGGGGVDPSEFFNMFQRGGGFHG